MPEPAKATTHQSADACRNCEAVLAGPYCHGCGEPAPSAHENSVKHLVHDAVHEFTHLDGKIFRTLWLLIRRPGLLTAEYWSGRRKNYIRPLRLYIVIAAIHLLAVSSSLYRVDFFTSLDNSGRFKAQLERVAARHKRPYSAVESEFNHTLAKSYSVAQYVAVLGFALVPWLLFRRRRSHYVEHLIFALHLYCFYFLLTSVAGLTMSPQQWRNSPLALVTLAYALFAVRRLYGLGWMPALACAVVLRVGLFAAEFTAIGVSMGIAVLKIQ